MTREELRELARRHIEQVWGATDHAALDDMYAEDVVDHAPGPGQSPGRAGLHEVMTAFSAAFPDLRMRLLAVHAEPDPADPAAGMAVDSWTLGATHLGTFLGVPATGRRVELRGIDVLRVAGGRIREVWHVEDLAGALRRLTIGTVDAGPLTRPPHAHAHALEAP